SSPLVKVFDNVTGILLDANEAANLALLQAASGQGSSSSKALDEVVTASRLREETQGMVQPAASAPLLNQGSLAAESLSGSADGLGSDLSKANNGANGSNGIGRDPGNGPLASDGSVGDGSDAGASGLINWKGKLGSLNYSNLRPLR